MKSVIKATGHPVISANHKTTFEITKEDFVTETGDCIIAINSDKAMQDLDVVLKDHLKAAKEINITIQCNGISDTVKAYGSPKLTFSDPHAIIIRTSDYVCDRTLCIRADKAAADLSRKLIAEIKKGAEVKITLELLG